MKQLVKNLASIDSGTYNLVGIERMRSELSAHFDALGGITRMIPSLPVESIDLMGNRVNNSLGSVLKIFKRPKAKMQVLLMGHMDTTFPKDQTFPGVQERDGLLIGPGVADMKAGLVIMLQVLNRVEMSDFKEQIGWEVILNADEEVGSPGSRAIIEESAKGKDFALIFEPSLPNGDLVSERAGSLNLTIIVKGTAAHAGRDFFSGRNAIGALCSFMLEVEALIDKKRGITINLGKVHGGSTLNNVADHAAGQINIRARDKTDFENVIKSLKIISEKIEKDREVTIELHTISQRPPKPLDSQTKKLFDALKHVSNQLGLSIGFQATNGVCDGNLVAAMGVPTIDSLGGTGGRLHCADEFLEVKSLEERAELTFLLLKKIVQEGL